MYASVRMGKTKPGIAKEIGQQVGDGFIPIVSQMAGFVGYFVVDLGGDRLMTISLFEDGTGTRESITAAQQWIQKNAADTMAGPLEILEGRVIAYKLVNRSN